MVAQTFIETFNSSAFSDEGFVQDDDSYCSDSFDDDQDDSTDDDATDHSIQENTEMEELHRKETRTIRVWRFIVVGMILVTGAVVTASVYLFLQAEESDDATKSFENFARTVADASILQSEMLLRALNNMAEQITVSSQSTNQPFPFVKVDLFEVAGFQTRELSGVEMFAFCPLVENNQRDLWKFFSSSRKDWYQESIELHRSQEVQLSITQYNDSAFRSDVWQEVPDSSDESFAWSDKRDIYAPIWQLSPPPFSFHFVNFDMMSEAYMPLLLPILNSTNDSIMTPVDPSLARLSGAAVSPLDHETYHSNFVESVNGQSYFDHPHSLYLQPVFKDLDRTEMGGFLGSVIPWDRYMSQLLPENVHGLYAVLKNNCGQSYTYVLNGRKVR